jgi:acylphosphatase
LVIAGKVQGVGFRWFVRERARRLGVAGWVRNESDGTVHIVVGGPASLVSRFVDELNVGPPNAVVETIRELELHEDGGDAGAAGPVRMPPALPYPFEIRR